MTCAISSVPASLPSLDAAGPLKEDKCPQQHYFSIGAMMNPTSVKNRQLNLELNANAVPGRLMDHKLVFFGSSGFAEVVYEKGSVMHGVVYRNVPQDQMKTLDNIERDYIRKSVTIHCYPPATKDGAASAAETVLENVSVYCRSQEDVEQSKAVDQPPTERYLQVLVEGAKHYGVDPSYVQSLNDHECRPRPPPSEYLTFSEVEGWNDNAMTRAQVDERGSGKDGQPLYARCRGRVIELLQDPSTAAMQSDYSESFLKHGRDLELFMAKVQYDPQFGIPSGMDKMTPEQAAITEHAFCEYFKGCNAMHKWRVIARIQD